MLNVRDDPQYQPPQIYAEAVWLYGSIVVGVLYGVVLILYAACARTLWRRIRTNDGSPRKNWFFFIYVNFIFALSTLYIAANSLVTQYGFINYRDYPGGPSAYESETSFTPLNVPFVISNWCADALMIWRCVVVYKDSRFHRVVTVFGCLILLASVVTGLLWLVIVSQPTQSSSWLSFGFLFPYLCISLAINILICILTVCRLLYHRSWISKVLGPEYGKLYASVAAIIVESAAVYAVCSVLSLVPYAMGNPLADACLQIIGEAQIIAPLLIIHRVSEGKAWTRDMATRVAPSTFQATPRLSTRLDPNPTNSTYSLPLEIQNSAPNAKVRLVDEEDRPLVV